ncbi:MAG: hypothetical protein H7Y41_07275 [Hyphomonadaceae bacterium]|nr:hypothetical protein [Clostridia bacterium]
MADLFVNLENQKVPIEQSQIDKYQLKAGDVSPNSRYHVVDKNGNEQMHSPDENKVKDFDLDEMRDDGIKLQTSEIIDISSGVDAEVEATL